MCCVAEENSLMDQYRKCKCSLKVSRSESMSSKKKTLFGFLSYTTRIWGQIRCGVVMGRGWIKLSLTFLGLDMCTRRHGGVGVGTEGRADRLLVGWSSHANKVNTALLPAAFSVTQTWLLPHLLGAVLPAHKILQRAFSICFALFSLI